MAKPRPAQLIHLIDLEHGEDPAPDAIVLWDGASLLRVFADPAKGWRQRTKGAETNGFVARLRDGWLTVYRGSKILLAAHRDDPDAIAVMANIASRRRAQRSPDQVLCDLAFELLPKRRRARAVVVDETAGTPAFMLAALHHLQAEDWRASGRRSTSARIRAIGQRQLFSFSSRAKNRDVVRANTVPQARSDNSIVALELDAKTMIGARGAADADRRRLFRDFDVAAIQHVGRSMLVVAHDRPARGSYFAFASTTSNGLTPDPSKITTIEPAFLENEPWALKTLAYGSFLDLDLVRRLRTRQRFGAWIAGVGLRVKPAARQAPQEAPRILIPTTLNRPVELRADRSEPEWPYFEISLEGLLEPAAVSQSIERYLNSALFRYHALMTSPRYAISGRQILLGDILDAPLGEIEGESDLELVHDALICQSDDASQPVDFSEARSFVANVEERLAPLFRRSGGAPRFDLPYGQPFEGWFVFLAGSALTTSPAWEAAAARSLALHPGAAVQVIPLRTDTVVVAVRRPRRHWTRTAARILAIRLLDEHADALRAPA